ncbi:hypothetical protein JT362_16095 [Actinophytocola sp. S1-96]|uniref:Tyr recombinase domain-containing protein n=2 Tax=Actinophytocola gossypii TaxID=2812003 RepID=A0ABT2J9U7_9PSEU|nr:hypothetical protein [Actinophytocola gossypii]
MRWGELTGLQWTCVDLHHGEIHVSRVDGALHKINGHHTLGRPKTPAGVRTIHLPRALIDRLHTHQQDSCETQAVFTATDGGWYRRSNFRRPVWLPAVNGGSNRRWTPLTPGVHSHGLRHTYKTRESMAYQCYAAPSASSGDRSDGDT